MSDTAEQEQLVRDLMDIAVPGTKPFAQYANTGNVRSWLVAGALPTQINDDLVAALACLGSFGDAQVNTDLRHRGFSGEFEVTESMSAHYLTGAPLPTCTEYRERIYGAPVVPPVTPPVDPPVVPPVQPPVTPPAACLWDEARIVALEQRVQTLWEKAGGVSGTPGGN